MTRWLLALLFAFGSVTFLTGCPAEEKSTEEKMEDAADDAKDAAGDAADAAGDAAEDAGDAINDATE